MRLCLLYFRSCQFFCPLIFVVIIFGGLGVAEGDLCVSVREPCFWVFVFIWGSLLLRLSSFLFLCSHLFLFRHFPRTFLRLKLLLLFGAVFFPFSGILWGWLSPHSSFLHRRRRHGVYVILLHQMFYRHFCALLLVSHSLFSRALSLSVGLFSARLSLSTPPSLPQSTLASRRRCFCRRRCPVCFFFLFLIEICGLHQYLLFPCVFHVIKNLVQVFFFFASVVAIFVLPYNIILQGWENICEEKNLFLAPGNSPPFPLRLGRCSH